MGNIHPCKGVRGIRWEDAVAGCVDKEQLKKCIRIAVFKIKPLFCFRVSFAPTSVLLTLNTDFFHKRQFFSASRRLPSLSVRIRRTRKPPNKKRIEQFCQKMLNIQIEFDDVFLIRTMPTLSELEMRLEFPFERLLVKDVKTEDILVENILRYLGKLWLRILNHKSLLIDGYDFRPSL